MKRKERAVVCLVPSLSPACAVRRSHFILRGWIKLSLVNLFNVFLISIPPYFGLETWVLDCRKSQSYPSISYCLKPWSVEAPISYLYLKNQTLRSMDGLLLTP